MKRIVVYQSATGFTAKYAGWIATELHCEAKKLKQTNLSDLSAYDMVIYGGWICANMISGYNKIKALNLSNVVVFGVGMSPCSTEVAARLVEQNGLDAQRFFYFEGGYKPEKVGFVKKLMMNMIKKSLEKKEEKSEEDLYMLETFKGADHTNKEAIKELLNYCL
ncbi:MAG: flavodoxin domain-containing protein [Acetatifactor sp.]